MSKSLLEEARENIDKIDSEMARLFEKRMEEARKVALYKKEVGMPIFDAAREAAVLARGAKRIENENLRDFYVNFLHSVMDVSKSYQSRLLNGMQIAFAGEIGAFAEIAAKRIFPEGTPCAFADFAETYNAVEKGLCDAAVLPLENSTNGDVGKVMDLAFFGSLYISGIYEIEVVQNLLAKKGASLSEIKTVISHPQALGQCAPFLKKLGVELKEASTTAAAAKMVAEGNDPTIAAIASAEAAEEFGLEVLRQHIHEKGGNTTRFAVFTRSEKVYSPQDRHFLMVFTVKNEAGALAKAISAIGTHGFNLQAIKSRPTKNLSWEYYFFCEGEGDIRGSEGEGMLSLLKENCNDLKILGTFEHTSKLLQEEL